VGSSSHKASRPGLNGRCSEVLLPAIGLVACTLPCGGAVQDTADTTRHSQPDPEPELRLMLSPRTLLLLLAPRRHSGLSRCSLLLQVCTYLGFELFPGETTPRRV
jgi:hypothetical protein